MYALAKGNPGRNGVHENWLLGKIHAMWSMSTVPFYFEDTDVDTCAHAIYMIVYEVVTYDAELHSMCRSLLLQPSEEIKEEIPYFEKLRNAVSITMIRIHFLLFQSTLQFFVIHIYTCV